MKKSIIACLLWCCAAAQGATTWFNVMGDPADENVNTIEVDPSPVSVSGETHIMRVRVSRSEERTNWEGKPYRSHVSEVLFDCSQGTASYLKVDYYSLPLWKGEPFLQSEYSPSDAHMMQFRDVEPNPYRRIIRAVCTTSSITNN